MQQSNLYIVIFTAIMTIIVGGALSLTSIVLGPAQKRSIELDTKSQILNAVTDKVKIDKGTDILALYDKRISSLVVDFNGNEITKDEKGNPIVAENVDILRNFKRAAADRQYPIFRLMNDNNPEEVEAYILPVYGNGLWDRIWGYVALDPEFQTILGVAFGHKAETPGLGQRIETPEIQNRFKGKKIFDEEGKLVSVTMVKGEAGGGGEGSIKMFQERPHQVDGLSGATLTAVGVNKMLETYLSAYKNYFNKLNAEKISAL
ncbi:MAG TPA: NADH:ubiquinone reductase (Na(+)-transporting) subunit C [Cyclobacteriaceae bacterium]|nr:NADH:ubiquinone reductase (Na(+)-transporting) subunit C [Cyclobacteriaceae bacterium]